MNSIREARIREILAEWADVPDNGRGVSPEFGAAIAMATDLLTAIDEARRERDELRLTLECEAGVRAPYGWVRTGGSWERPDVAAIGQIKPGRWAYQIKADGYKIEGHFTYALAAIRAADNAAKEQQ